MEHTVRLQASNLVLTHRLPEAYDLLDSALTRYPDSPYASQWRNDLCDVCNSLGMSHLSKGDEGTSWKLLKKAEKLAGKNSEARAAVMNNLGCYYRKTGKPRLALICVQQALHLDHLCSTSPVSTHINFCAILSQLGHHSQAETHIMQALILLQAQFLLDSLHHHTQSQDNIEVMVVAYHNYAAELEFLQRVSIK